MKISKLALYAFLICCTALFVGQAAAEHSAGSAEAETSTVEQSAVTTAATSSEKATEESETDESPASTDAPFVPLSFAGEAMPTAGNSLSSRNHFTYTKICPVTCQLCRTAADCSWGACKSLPYCP